MYETHCDENGRPNSNRMEIPGFIQHMDSHGLQRIARLCNIVVRVISSPVYDKYVGVGLTLSLLNAVYDVSLDVLNVLVILFVFGVAIEFDVVFESN